MAQTASSRCHGLSQRARKLLRVRKPVVRRRETVGDRPVKVNAERSLAITHASLTGTPNPNDPEACSNTPLSSSEAFSPLDTPSPDTSASHTQPQPTHSQGQSSFFRKLPLEIREQIYAEYWQCAGLDRHVYLEHDEFRFALCKTDHDAPEDACQAGLAHDFYPEPMVQRHPKWYNRMTSSWCNHWKCEEAMWQRRKPVKGSTKVARDDLLTCLPLLLSCQRIYVESLPSLHKSTTLTITDKDTLYALLIRRRRHTSHAVYAFLPRIRTLNIALRAGAPDFLHLHGPALWRALTPEALPSLRRISLWLDGHEPIQRRLLPQFRDLWTHVPGPVARKLSVSLPVGPDGLWAWGEVEVRPRCGGGEDVAVLPAFQPGFEVVLRGWQAYTETSAGWISRGGGAQGPGERRVLTPGNPFEDLRLYGRGWFDDFYFSDVSPLSGS